MDPRVGACQVRWPRIACRIALLALAGTAICGAASASPQGDPFRQIRLVKLPNDDLRIEWRAAVYETGGSFLLSRGAPASPRRLVARVAPGTQRQYRVTDSVEPGAWVYELRYRDARGREIILATIELNLDELERGPVAAAPRPGLDTVPVGTDATGFGAVPASLPIAVSADDGLPIALRGRPPTPPPRAHA
jgi:hypothetical protein